MYYLIKENNTLLITSNTEDFGCDTSAVLIASSRSIKKLSKEAFNGLLEKIEQLNVKIEQERRVLAYCEFTCDQLSEQLQQLNFSK